MELWYPKAKRVDGPAHKTSGSMVPKAVMGHSMVGFKSGAHDVLFDRGRVYEASWHFSVYYDGAVEQHYSITTRTWHGHGANPFAIGVEHEGGYSPENEPLRPAQLAASIELFKWIAKQGGFELIRNGDAFPSETLLEHNQYANKPCPSNRIPWAEYTKKVAAPMVEYVERAEFAQIVASFEAYLNEVNARLLTLEAKDPGIDDLAIMAKMEELRRDIANARIVLGG